MSVTHQCPPFVASRLQARPHRDAACAAGGGAGGYGQMRRVAGSASGDHCWACCCP